MFQDVYLGIMEFWEEMKVKETYRVHFCSFMFFMICVLKKTRKSLKLEYKIYVTDDIIQ